jgi:hypothetical protein
METILIHGYDNNGRETLTFINVESITSIDDNPVKNTQLPTIVTIRNNKAYYAVESKEKLIIEVVKKKLSE